MKSKSKEKIVKKRIIMGNNFSKWIFNDIIEEFVF